MNIVIKKFPFGTESIKPTVATRLYIDTREVIRDVEVFIQYHGWQTAYRLGIDGSLTGYLIPEGGLVCEIVISKTKTSLITNKLIGNNKAHRIHKIVEEFLGSLGIQWFSMEIKESETA